MAEQKQVFIELDKIPTKFIFEIPKPVYYDNESIIISCDHQEINAEVIKYEFNSNTIEPIYRYNINDRFKQHAQFIDLDNNILYLFGGVNDVFCAINLQNHEKIDININETNEQFISKLKKVGTGSNSTYIPKPINQVHVIRSVI